MTTSASTSTSTSTAPVELPGYVAPPDDLIFDDGEPMENAWHRDQMLLLIDVIQQAMSERGRDDYHVGGNEFVYYSAVQARAVKTQSIAETRHFRGPDVYWVAGVEDHHPRQGWVVWDEGGRYPDLIVELLSPSTARVDRTTKKEIYRRTFRTPDYFMYDPLEDRVEGFRLADADYRPVEPDAHGRYRVASLDLWLGRWQGRRVHLEATWLRLFDADGRMIPTLAEAAQAAADAAQARADSETARADAETARADSETARADAEQLRAAAAEERAAAAEAELARYRGESRGRAGE